MDGWNTTFLLGRHIFRGYVSLREDRFDFLAGILTSITPSFFKAFPRFHPSKPTIKRRSRPPGSMMGPLRLVINGRLSMILPTQNSGNGSCHEVDHKEKYTPRVCWQDLVNWGALCSLVVGYNSWFTIRSPMKRISRMKINLLPTYQPTNQPLADSAPPQQKKRIKQQHNPLI